MEQDNSQPEEFNLDFMVKGLIVLLIIMIVGSWYIFDWLKQLF